MKNLFKQLYESEINLQFGWFWDAGFDIKIGNDMSGYVAEFNSYNLDECEEWIVDKVIELYPNSKFAKEYNGNQNSVMTIIEISKEYHDRIVGGGIFGLKQKCKCCNKEVESRYCIEHDSMNFKKDLWICLECYTEIHKLWLINTPKKICPV